MFRKANFRENTERKPIMTKKSLWQVETVELKMIGLHRRAVCVLRSLAMGPLLRGLCYSHRGLWPGREEG